MSATKNECEIVNRLSRKVEKELSDNMASINEDITEINEKLEDVAVIDDTEASTTTTYSSEKIEDLISDIPTGAEIDDSTETTTKTWSSFKIKTEIDAGGGGSSEDFNLVFMNSQNLTKLLNTATYTNSDYQLDTEFTAFSIPSFRVNANHHILLAFDIHTISANNGVTSIDIEIQLTNSVNRLNFTVSKEGDANLFAIPLYSFGFVNDSATVTGTVKYTVHGVNENPGDLKTAFTLYDIS